MRERGGERRIPRDRQKRWNEKLRQREKRE
jgi:hypothetical protein